MRKKKSIKAEEVVTNINKRLLEKHNYSLPRHKVTNVIQALVESIIEFNKAGYDVPIWGLGRFTTNTYPGGVVIDNPLTQKLFPGGVFISKEYERPRFHAYQMYRHEIREYYNKLRNKDNINTDIKSNNINENNI